MNSLDRRKFVGVSGAGAAAAGAAALGGMSASSAAADVRRPVYMKLGCQSGPSSDEHFAFLARYGIANIVASPIQADRSRLYATVDEMKALISLAEKHALSVDMTNAGFMSSGGRPSDIMLGLPGRDREIEAFQTLIKNCAEAGIPAIKYNLALMPILRSAVIPGRGDTFNHRWRISEMQGNPLMTIWDGGSLTEGEFHRPSDTVEAFTKLIGHPSADEIWGRITYFLDRVVPVANQYKIRMALHPEDPGVPPEGYHGVVRVLGTIEGLKKFVGIQESPYHGMAFCQGTISEDLEDPGHQIYDVIRWFGERKKIFLVHFRNVRGHRDDVVIEIFPDEGSVNMAKAVRTYREVGYDGMLVPDHIPMGPESSGPANFAFCYGYIRGLLQFADEE
ncbi:MAG TPA: mannonate dehydratase [Rhizomicrobium sp.]|jgi:mannonate dehydratase|nr:mannonate dehydratase [Rhizomicrobium sp.]